MAWQGHFEDFDPFTVSLPPKTPGNHIVHNNTGGQRTVQQPGKMQIANLSPGTTATLIAVVINREEPRNIPNKKDPTSERTVMCMTIRDSPADFINASCWGSERHIREMASIIHIGDVIQISNALVQSKPTDGTDEKYRPWTPSMCQLTISESRSTVILYSGYDSKTYMQMGHIPVKPSNDYYTLADVQNNGQNLSGELINLLAVVKNVGIIKEITTKTGKRTKRCEIKLWDETHPNLPMVLWDEELTNLAQTLTPMDNVLFIADVRVNFDNFRKAMVATATGKTIITVNPDTKDAHNLYSMAQSAEITPEETSALKVDISADNNIDLTTIQQVYRVCDIAEKMGTVIPAGHTSASGDNSDYGIVYAFITKLDLDGSVENCVITRCGKCRFRIDSAVGYCMNQDCPIGSNTIGGDEVKMDSGFFMRVDLTDHTGTVSGAFLQGEVASKMLDCSAEEFETMHENLRTELKWRYLLEKCKVYFKMNLPTFDGRKGIVKVLSCERANLHEAVRFLH